MTDKPQTPDSTIAPRFGLGAGLTNVLVKTGPVFVVVATTLAVWGLGLADKGVEIVGTVPQSLPLFTLPSFSPVLLGQLLLPAFLILIIRVVMDIKERSHPQMTLVAMQGSQSRIDLRSALTPYSAILYSFAAI